MLNLTIPDAKICALINGKAIATPRALAVFEDGAKLVIARITMVDCGLSHGALCTERAVLALHHAYPHLMTNKDDRLSVQDVIWIAKKANWKSETVGQFPRHLVESAKMFLECCVRTCAEIDLAC